VKDILKDRRKKRY